MTLEPLEGLRVLDLFAGSGALGIEALSRGAARVDFVERDPGALRVLARNIATLGLQDRTTTWPLPLPQGLKQLSSLLPDTDLILLDPPYRQEVSVVLERLGRPGMLREEARVVLEHAARDEAPASAGCLSRVRTRHYGDTAVTWYRVDSSHPRGSSRGPDREDA